MKTISVFRLVFGILIFGLGLCAQAVEIKLYTSRFEVAQDGSAIVTVNVNLTGVQGPGRLLLPVGSPGLDDFKIIESPTDIQLTPLPKKSQSLVEVNFGEKASGNQAIKFSYKAVGFMEKAKAAEGKKIDIPTNNSLVKHSLINTQENTIESYQAEVILPDHVRVQLIREQLPKPKKTDVLPRVRLDGFTVSEGSEQVARQGAQLQMSQMKQGDRTSMVLEAVDDRRSYGWLLVGLAIAIGYLITFTSLVNPKNDANTTAKNQTATP